MNTAIKKGIIEVSLSRKIRSFDGAVAILTGGGSFFYLPQVRVPP